MSLTILCPRHQCQPLQPLPHPHPTPPPPHPRSAIFNLCLKSKSNLAESQSHSGRKSGRSQTVSLTSGPTRWWEGEGGGGGGGGGRGGGGQEDGDDSLGFAPPPPPQSGSLTTTTTTTSETGSWDPSVHLAWSHPPSGEIDKMLFRGLFFFFSAANGSQWVVSEPGAGLAV